MPGSRQRWDLPSLRRLITRAMVITLCIPRSPLIMVMVTLISNISNITELTRVTWSGTAETTGEKLLLSLNDDLKVSLFQL